MVLAVVRAVTRVVCVAGETPNLSAVVETCDAVTSYDPAARSFSVSDAVTAREKPEGPVTTIAAAAPAGRPVTVTASEPVDRVLIPFDPVTPLPSPPSQAAIQKMQTMRSAAGHALTLERARGESSKYMRPCGKVQFPQ